MPQFLSACVGCFGSAGTISSTGATHASVAYSVTNDSEDEDFENEDSENEDSENEYELPEPARPIVALQLKDVDQQLQSPLYDGKIPPDIRNMIFDYALAEYVDSQALYPTITHYTRPNFIGTKRVCINLLLMCKRSYLETSHVPPRNKTHTFWHAGGPPNERFNDNELLYFGRFQPAQLALVKEIHLFTQQWWLEREFHSVCRLAVLRGIEKVKITLRRVDWWNNEYRAPMAITPQRPGADVNVMKRDWAAEKAGEIVEWDKNCWGSAFRHLKGLKELEMEFEAYDFKATELDEIVRHAVLWKFPMGNGQVLSSDGLADMKTSTWEDPPSAWYSCPKCAGRNANCKFCEEMVALKMQGTGYTFIVKSLSWKLADAK